ncbi:MAG TPA: hypothetical protein VFU38_09390 [Candidatus Krumholzibacteria bacterium]|nr:hypothetical protein [Candidatus Krumholzibacteria bacterium]
MHKRHIASAALVLLAAMGFVGCDDAPEEGRVTVGVTLNGGAPLESDVSDAGVVFEDFVDADFFLRPYNNFITAPRGDVIVESYRVTWERTDGGSGTLSPREETINLYLPIDATMPIGSVIRLVTWDDKTGTILAPLVGTTNTVEMRVTVEFTCREPATDSEIKTSASASVHFADTV